jgi:magnesium chelatase family protein
VAVLAAAGTVPASGATEVAFLAELGLDGRLRPVRGVLPAVLAAARERFATVLAAPGNAAEAMLVPGIEVVTASTLADVVDWLRGTPGRPAPAGTAPDSGPEVNRVRREPAGCGTVPGTLDLAGIHGQELARLGLEICAAGGHHLSLLGPPGTGKTMLAERLPGILPPLDAADALDVTAVHSVAGALAPGMPLLTVPPFVAPHHTASKAAIVGGGSGPLLRPGAASLAHCGVLFLDETPEFGRDVLDALRQPLEAGEIVLARSGVTARFPARFMLVMAANPCPCAKAAGPAEGCSCSPTTRRRYLGRISGPLLDRVDVKIELLPAGRKELLNDRGMAEQAREIDGEFTVLEGSGARAAWTGAEHAYRRCTRGLSEKVPSSWNPVAQRCNSPAIRCSRARAPLRQ